MADTIKLMNPQKFDVGIKRLNDSVGINIRAGSFAMVTEDDIAYLASVSDVFRRGILRVEQKNLEAMQAAGIDQENDPNFITNEEIARELGGTARKIREWLRDVNEGHILDRVYDVAMGMNLSQDKLKALQEKMPDKAFLEN